MNHTQDGKPEEPEEIKQARLKIESYTKEQARLKQIGKFFMTWMTQNSNDQKLRRIYLDKDNKTIVDEWTKTYFPTTLTFKTWEITEALDMYNSGSSFSRFEETTPINFYNILKRFLEIEQIKENFIPKEEKPPQ